MRTVMLAVASLGLSVTACSSYDTSPTYTDTTPVASVSVTLPSPAIMPGQTEHGVAVARDANGSPLSRAINWQSSNPQSASVNDSGMVAAVAPGAALIIASSEGVTGQASLTVLTPPPIPVATVLVALNPSSLVVGQTGRATATLLDPTGNSLSGRVVTWQTSNPSVASVSANGDVSAVAAGSSIISATSEGQSGSASLAVTTPAPIPVATVSVSPSGSSILIGASAQLTAVTRDANGNVLSGRVVTWSSANASIAAVSSSGLVTGVAAGTAAITASSEGRTGIASVTVNAPAPVPVASVAVTPATSSIQAGATVQLSAVTRDVNGNVLTGRTVSWSSGSTGIATVSGSGLVTGVAAGTATITATSEGRSGTASITVTAPAPVPVASVTVSPATSSVIVGATAQLSAVTRDASGNVLTGRVVSWRTGNSALATVSGAGLVTGVAAGTTTITATSETISGTASVTVSPPPVITAPEPAPGDVTLVQNSFNNSTIAEILGQYANRGDIQLVPGRSGSAVRFTYSSSSYDNLLEMIIPQSTDTYFRFFYRLSVGADPTCGGRGDSGMKWFMAWRPDPAPRYTMGVGNLDGGPATALPNAGNEFTTHDNSSTQMPNPFLSNINKSLRFSTTNDGAWHEYTLHIVTGNGGYEQIWVDGVLVLDNSAYGYDHSAVGISLIQFPGTLVTWFAGCDFTIDVDDLVVWHK